eukprot:m.111081 g.111081  ORF g.111081 m.111081 type:complete len:278 (-) comp22754_c0_seq3:67-900(-)
MSLASRICAQTAQARALGHLYTFDSSSLTLTDVGLEFLVRVASSLHKKPKALGSNTPAKKNPFEPPYEEGLFVEELPPSHVLLLNKYNVVNNHILVCTKEFKEQNTILDNQDFKALWQVVNETNSLGFYNCGLLSGASQPHKHMQAVPMESGIPVDGWLQEFACETGVYQFPKFRFKHACHNINSAETSPEILCKNYHSLLTHVGINPQEHSGSYNFLITKKWMLLVPRSKEKHEGISINSLGFAGTLFVKRKTDLDTIKKVGPLELLAQLAMPIST